MTACWIKRSSTVGMPSFRTPPPSGVGVSPPPHRLWFIGPVQQLLPNGQPVLLEIVAELIDRHPVDARATFVAPHLPQRLLQVCSFTYVLHDSTRVGWAFGLTHRRRRFDVFPSRLPGFTRRRR